jgi:hypothetical protein
MFSAATAAPGGEFPLITVIGAPALGGVTVGTPAAPIKFVFLSQDYTIVQNALRRDGPASSNRSIEMTTAGVLRWNMTANDEVEAGANAGSNFFVNRYSDAGALLGIGAAILRKTGWVYVPVASVPAFANNAAAIAGGMAAGLIYRTGADPDALCIVH